MNIQNITIEAGVIFSKEQRGSYNPYGYPVAVCGHTLTAGQVAELIKALLPYLTELDALAIHETLGKACEGGDCPCEERGFQDGRRIQPEPVGV